MNKPSLKSIGSKTWHKVVMVLVAVGVVGTLATFMGINWWYSTNLEPLSTGKVEEKVVTVESGMNSTMIGELLKNNGVIKNARAFGWYVSRQGVRAKLQAGTYKFSPTQSVARITEMLVNGEVDTTHLTILSGKRLDQTKAAFVKSGFKADEVDKAFQADQYRAQHPSLKDLPPGGTLEGYLYPETFKIDSTTTVKQIVGLSLAEMDENLTPDLVQQLKAKGFNIHQAVTLASIIEKETSTLKDRPIVAQVFEKRLSIGMALGSDVTFIYAAALSGQAATPDLDSPYNTRKVTGLPPGPISNFTISSLEAVAKPADTDFLFFVAGDDGTVHYGKTVDEHNANVNKYCTKLCQ